MLIKLLIRIMYITSSCYDHSEVNDVSANQNVRTSISTDRANDKSATRLILVLANVCNHLQIL